MTAAACALTTLVLTDHSVSISTESPIFVLFLVGLFLSFIYFVCDFIIWFSKFLYNYFRSHKE